MNSVMNIRNHLYMKLASEYRQKLIKEDLT